MVIIIGVISAILWVFFKTNDDWNNMTKPPEGWIQHKGWRQKI
ncbi:MAG: hypothetical protein RLY43_52 [Bacteroidota bacterium]|jgi:hypothetical protein